MDTPITFQKPFAFIKRHDDQDILILEGAISSLQQLEDIPRISAPTEIPLFDTLSLLPFSQIHERGFLVQEDHLPILTLHVEQQIWWNPKDALRQLPKEKVSFQDGMNYRTSQQDYDALVQKIIDDEIGKGEGANFVIMRDGTAQIQEFSLNKALSIYRNLLQNEQGAYWVFLFFDGSSFFIGATPERHLTVQGSLAKMNPISGTFRKVGKSFSPETFQEDFLKFLENPKEINELFMVLDEELKMMANICNHGGRVQGPFLKEMSKLIHTEYVLEGTGDRDLMQMVRDSMYAATVTGSPVENACRIIHKYEPDSRRYYSSALLLIGRDEQGETADSPILIRTVEIDHKGTCSFRVGATLVRDSIPTEETLETEAKIAGLLENIINPPAQPLPNLLPNLQTQINLQALLEQRNRFLSPFWLDSQSEPEIKPQFEGKQAVLIHHEDDFCLMLKHLLKHLGFKPRVVSWKDYNIEKDDADLTVLGPGPGDPTDLNSAKMKALHQTAKEFLKREKVFLGVCLGHQMISLLLGCDIECKEIPLQGVQKEIDWFGTLQKVGFYNTFIAKYSSAMQEIEICYDETSLEVYGLRGKHFCTMQFHVESVLTQQGFSLLNHELLKLFS